MLDANITGRGLIQYLIEAYPCEPKEVIMEYTGLKWRQVTDFVQRARRAGHAIPTRELNLDSQLKKGKLAWVDYLIENYPVASRQVICRTCGGLTWGTVQDYVRRLRRLGYPIPERSRREIAKRDPANVLDEVPFEKLTTLPRRQLVEAIMLYRERKK